METRILIADDEPDVLKLLAMNFASAGFSVVEVTDGSAALASARRHPPALAVLDIMMPGLTGLEVTRALKNDSATASIPIILLSAHAQEANRIVGFELGAEDFVTKPFSPRELILRARSILRSQNNHLKNGGPLRVGEVEIDQDCHLVRVEGRPVALTAIEFKLVVALAREPRRVLSREQLLTRVWGDEVGIDTRTVDTHIRRLRDKLGPAAAQIETARGFGYALNERRTAGQP